MEEEVIQPENPKEESPTVPEQEKPKKVVIDSTKPLTGQVNKMLAAVPEEPKEEVKEKAKEEKKEEAPAEEVELEEIPEETQLEDLPAWQKYVLDNLPTIQVMGHEGENGKDKLYNVKRLEDLPDEFEFASKRAELAFNASLSSQEMNARDILKQYEGEQQKRDQQIFEQLEAVDIQSDVKSLQKAGVLPKFKYEPNDPRFNDDPAVEDSNKIYDFYKKINDEYFQKYNGSGRMYRVSYEDAAYRYYALNPKEATPEIKEAIKKEEAKPKSEAQEQREKVAAKVSAPSGSDTGGKPRPLPRGTSLQNIYQAYKRGAI